MLSLLLAFMVLFFVMSIEKENHQIGLDSMDISTSLKKHNFSNEYSDNKVLLKAIKSQTEAENKE